MKLATAPTPWLRILFSKDRGQIIVLAALVVSIVLGMGALAVDVGFFLHERQNVQSAVDAGALAGAQLLPDDATTAATIAKQFTLANDPSLDPANVSVTFRCLVGDRDGNGQPDASDIPGVCNPGADASWFVRSGLAVSPCVPSQGDKCNVIFVAASNTVKFYLAPAVGMKTGDTGSLTSAACNGPCGGPPTAPVDVMLVVDRTASMSATDITNVRNASKSILSMYNPALQWVGVGLLGPSLTSSSCTGVNSPAKGKAASSVPGYTAPTYLTPWVPVGLSGIGAPAPGFNESYATNGTLNTSSMLVKVLNCFDNPGGTGTDLATPVRMAAYYLNTYGRAGVRKGIILETDGQPNAGPSAGPNYCAQADTEATTAKNAGIEIFTIGFGLDGSNNANCPDTSGTFKSKTATYLLAHMATQPTTDNLCVQAENTDGDHFFCQPRTQDLASVFQSVASTLAAGAHLIALPE